MQINQQLIQRVFKLRTAVSRLKADVAKLGGGQDTVEHRKTVADAISRIQEDAKDIKERLLNVAPENKNRQTAKILSDFEVGTFILISLMIGKSLSLQNLIPCPWTLPLLHSAR